MPGSAWFCACTAGAGYDNITVCKHDCIFPVNGDPVTYEPAEAVDEERCYPLRYGGGYRPLSGFTGVRIVNMYGPGPGRRPAADATARM